MTTSDHSNESLHWGGNRSFWVTDEPRTDHPMLMGEATADVAVIGAGITGLTTALLLRRAGLQVAVLEASRVGCGVTGCSTAKVTSLHKAIYSHLEQSFDQEAARIYAEANETAVARICEFAEAFGRAGIDCRLERLAAYTYTRDPSLDGDIREEAEAAGRAGLAASYVDHVELPFDVVSAVRVENQAQFDPYRYCLGLASACAAEGVEIFESTRIRDVSVDGDSVVCEAVSGEARLRAGHVVVATLLPFLDRGGFFARAFPSRTYGIAASLSADAPIAMSINLGSPTRSVRSQPDGRGIIVVGEEHKVGTDNDTRARYAALEAWAREHFPVAAVTARWSAQDYMSADSVPYVGKVPAGSDRIWTATGFSKWGLTNGTAAAMILTDLIQGREHPWAGLFDSTRMDLLPSAKKLIKENAEVAAHFVGDRLRALTVPGIADLEPGAGGIVHAEGERLAAYRDDTGIVHACSAVCTHMGCYVQWNSAEKSWDCPCHGSRFGYDGRVLQGPAVRGLERKQIDES
jgi:glycine/D-amino acid oxidase-like deaminating enzyme/nitrite reductase/ring-hydroxylating ferredoxin subunit